MPREHGMLPSTQAEIGGAVTTQQKVMLWVAAIGALGAILAASVAGLIDRPSGTEYNQKTNSGNNVACSDHSTCKG